MPKTTVVLKVRVEVEHANNAEFWERLEMLKEGALKTLRPHARITGVVTHDIPKLPEPD